MLSAKTPYPDLVDGTCKASSEKLTSLVIQTIILLTNTKLIDPPEYIEFSKRVDTNLFSVVSNI